MPAIRKGIPFARYLQIDAVSWSSLKYLDQSPLHYKHNLDNPIKATPAMRLGRAAHTLALEPRLFASEFAVYEGDRRAGQDWQAFAAANADRDILKASETGTARAIAAAVHAHPLLAGYREGADYEVTVTWTDAGSGIRCKARPDWLPPKVLIDLKTSNTINELRFASHAEKLGYFNQLGHYVAGLEACGHPVEKVLLVAVEAKPPHDIAVFTVAESSIASARQEVSELLKRLRACRDSGRWPGRYESEQLLERPEWATGSDLSITFDDNEEE